MTTRTITKVEGIVRASANGAHIYLPKDWIGKMVIVRLA